MDTVVGRWVFAKLKMVDILGHSGIRDFERLVQSIRFWFLIDFAMVGWIDPFSPAYWGLLIHGQEWGYM
jgi:hypothetical protein